jgi:FHA domain
MQPIVTNQFFEWFYYGLSGLGGWLIFLLLAVLAVIVVSYDSARRRLPAIGWRMGIIITACLILPAILYRFTIGDPPNPDAPLYDFSEIIFYLGILGGVLPPVLAIGYFVSYIGMKGCPQGHVYESSLGQCPECARVNTPPPPPVAIYPPAMQPPIHAAAPAPQNISAPAQPPKPKTQAWLVAADGHSYQLNLGETMIGRSSQNDIQFTGDATLGRQHAKIVEQNGHFRLVDLGAKNYTRVNGHIVRQPVLLEPDDDIQFGDNTVVRFVTSRR